MNSLAYRILEDAIVVMWSIVCIDVHHASQPVATP